MTYFKVTVIETLPGGGTILNEHVIPGETSDKVNNVMCVAFPEPHTSIDVEEIEEPNKL